MPEIALVDTGPIVALFDGSEPRHAEVMQVVQRFSGLAITNLAVITEAMYLLDFSVTAQSNLLTWLARGAVRLMEFEDADFVRIGELMTKYADLPMNFADATLVAQAERLNVRTIMSFDGHFSIYRLRGRTSFRHLIGSTSR